MTSKTQNSAGESMNAQGSVIAVYHTHIHAESAIRELEHAGFDLKNLSIVGKDYHTEEHVVGYYNTGDRMKYWGAKGSRLKADAYPQATSKGTNRTGSEKQMNRRVFAIIKEAL